MTYYVTKYALTQGIVEVPEDRGQNHIGYLYYDHGGWSIQVTNKDWFTDLPAATARAEAMREAKIKSLQKQLQKMKLIAIGVRKLRDLDTHEPPEVSQ